MRPLNRYERFVMWVEMKLCRHEYFPIKVPSGWKYMSGSMVCQKCPYSIPIEVEIEPSDTRINSKQEESK